MKTYKTTTKFRAKDYVKINEYIEHRNRSRLLGQMEELLNTHYNKNPKFNNTLKVDLEGEMPNLYFSVTLTLSVKYSVSGADVKNVLIGKA